MGLPLPSCPFLESEVSLQNGARIRFSVRTRYFREKGLPAAAAAAAPHSRDSCKAMKECRRSIFPEPKGKKAEKKN